MHLISFARTVFRYQKNITNRNSPFPSNCFLLNRRFYDKFDVNNAPFRIRKLSLSERLYITVLGELKSVNNARDLCQLVSKNLSNCRQRLKKHSVNIVKLCTQQFEFVVAHRMRRGQQVFSLYSRIWEEKALVDIVNNIRRRLFNHGREIVFSVCGVAFFNWEKERIPEDMLLSYKSELDVISELKNSTVFCQACGHRLVVDRVMPGVVYCSCPHSTSATNNSRDNWVPFAERQDMLIWRKEHKDHQGLYMYKVYGRFEEVNAQDFFHVQIDTSYRLKWDRTVADLHVVDSDPSSNSDVIYWEVKWPHMFANRDYVFKRRFIIDMKQKMMIIVNENTEHPAVPPKSSVQRVSDYWSYMVIKPLREFSEPGIEFVLTYFDDPGLSMPSYLAGWIAMSALPDFLVRLREAAQRGQIRSDAKTYGTVASDFEALVGATAVQQRIELIV
ncbi:hypothetical protein J437_LFUL004279 [Ladona fulva]|uniref:Phosphatidylcholine transfer protein n=1 Tax=Ladona fulva TaxID=123851 RepID=A0A8K0K1N0_LADFU|nr:hypothetical protein J437_LFUL004279 [Ladona fulva]